MHRPISTCNQCRKRKVRCDRACKSRKTSLHTFSLTQGAVPSCGRCVKRNKRCKYGEEEDEEESDSSEDDLAQHPLQAQIDRQNRAILSLQRQLRTVRRPTQVRTPESRRAQPGTRALPITISQDELPPVRHQARPQRPPTVPPSETLRPQLQIQGAAAGPHFEGIGVPGQFFDIGFFGMSHPKSLLRQMPAVTALSKEIAQSHPVLQEVHSRITHTHLSNSAVSRCDEKYLLGFLPPNQAGADDMIHLYLRTFDNIYHIIHKPDFFRKYLTLWSSGVTQRRPQFVALVLLIIASACSLSQHDSFLYKSKNSLARQHALESIRACEDWHRKNKKHKTTSTTDLQIRFLICFAKWVNGAESKRAWETASMNIRYAMAAGLHLEPSKLFSTKEQEMRRRLWASFVEFELQTAFIRGMPADPLAGQSNIALIRNVNDIDLTVEITSLPQAQPIEVSTGISYLCQSAQSLNLRRRLTHVLNSATVLLLNETQYLS